MIRFSNVCWLLCMGMSVFVLPVSASPWFIEGAAGISRLRVDQDQVLLDSGKSYYYQGSSHRSDHSKGIYGLGVGYRWDSEQWGYEMALHYEQRDAQTFGGTVAPIEPQFTVLNARYDISGKSLMLSGKALLHTDTAWSPYFMAGLGYARNRFENYSLTQRSTHSSSDAEYFGSHDTGNIAWQTGLGVRYRWTQQLGVDLGYQYSEFGDAVSAAGQRSGQKVKIDNLSASALVMGINYQF